MQEDWLRAFGAILTATRTHDCSCPPLVSPSTLSATCRAVRLGWGWISRAVTWPVSQPGRPSGLFASRQTIIDPTFGWAFAESIASADVSAAVGGLNAGIARTLINAAVELRSRPIPIHHLLQTR